jgi:hypothetical protein
MPLVISSAKPTYEEPRRMVGMWMRVPGVIGSVNAVRVFITLEALWSLEQSQVRDVYAALATFERNLGRIALAASRKFDDRGPEEGEKYEGQPIVVLTTYELWQLPRDRSKSTEQR